MFASRGLGAILRIRSLIPATLFAAINHSDGRRQLTARAGFFPVSAKISSLGPLVARRVAAVSGADTATTAAGVVFTTVIVAATAIVRASVVGIAVTAIVVATLVVVARRGAGRIGRRQNTASDVRPFVVLRFWLVVVMIRSENGGLVLFTGAALSVLLVTLLRGCRYCMTRMRCSVSAGYLILISPCGSFFVCEHAS